MSSESVRCPSCHDADEVRRSHRRKRDWPFRLMGMRAYRCLLCNKRFYAKPRPHEPGGERVA